VIQITPLHPLFASEVTGLDLVTGPDDATFAQIEDAFRRRSVLVFREQAISDEIQIRFSQRFGPLETTKVGTNGAGSHLVVLSNIGPEGQIVPPTSRQMLNNRANQFWHTDSSFKPNPARASMLSARAIPLTGGDTQYCCMRAVYTALPERLRDAVEGRVAIHDYTHSRSRIDPELVTVEERKAVPPVRQAMVLDHGPELGRSLYLGAHAAKVEGMSDDAGRSLIDELMAFATRDRFVYTHQWRPFDLILWDNRAVLHRATPFRGTTEARHMVRTTIAGGGPTVADARAVA
jgi:alpha-ketoglutarate-dependent 2,4-dichlorophenoxyacetate dioxygenase